MNGRTFIFQVRRTAELCGSKFGRTVPCRAKQSTATTYGNNARQQRAAKTHGNNVWQQPSITHGVEMTPHVHFKGDNGTNMSALAQKFIDLSALFFLIREDLVEHTHWWVSG